ncbi:VOC family protein [Rhodococcus artemisiae]|uniref:VOC family protein n=1 Tax=Rhodococcus artemisiae TaxID=714159 RepID=A0ABU7LJG6_9NOCA|nr:VOC family protein [Rhodococcus artemisiae]MEE2061047.1 VOC family protein [Rhodococcus artemisiae]
MPALTPCLWFDMNAQEAAEFYASVFPNSKILSTSYYPEDGPFPPGTVLTVEFELDGSRFTGLNGGPQFTFSEAVSFKIDCGDQDEVDHYWNSLIADGGEESQCGWLKDRFGVSWQVVPRRLMELLTDPDPKVAERVSDVMMKMRKIEIAPLEEAARG